MIETKQLTNPSLEAKSPFELRVNLGRDVPESDVPRMAIRPYPTVSPDRPDKPRRN